MLVSNTRPTTSLYNVFIQRFSEQFHKEIDCADNEATLQIIITLMNKCGLRELLDPPTITTSILSRTPNSSPHTHVSSPGMRSGIGAGAGAGASAGAVDGLDVPSTKRSNGYHIWQRERRQRWIAEGKLDPAPNYGSEWRLLPNSTREDYKAYAKNLRS